MENKKHTLLVTIGLVVIIGIISGVTYAFFNYTRTGSANTVSTGRIYFNHEQGNAINLTNVFPIDVTNGIPNNDSNVGSVTINVTGDTTYTDGIEYLVSAVNVNNTVGSGNNQKTVPISIDVSVTSNTNNNPVTTLGTADESYFTNRGASANTSIYKVLAKETISEDDQLLVGYIKSGSTGVDGNIVIRAYIDMSKVAISDTYPEGNVEINNQNYYNGTTEEWAGERVVITTDEWNALSSNGISFQVKVEANEGIWVEEPVIATCPGVGCKYMFTTNTYYYGGNANATAVSSLSGVTTDYTTLNENYFLGFTETEDGKIDRAYACGIKQEDPNQGILFCIEGTTNGSLSSANRDTIHAIYGDLYNYYLGCNFRSQTAYACFGSNELTSISVTDYTNGQVLTHVTTDISKANCSVNTDSTLKCSYNCSVNTNGTLDCS